MTEKKLNSQNIEEVYNLLAKINNPDEMELLLKDLCTNKEIEQMAQRITAARLLMEGNTYSQVIEKTDISSATLSRVSSAVKYGEGYKKYLK